MSGYLNSRHRVRRSGVAVVYMLIMFTVLAALVSLAVDFGRVSLDKAELQVTADAAARHGAEGLPTTSQISNAQTVAAANLIEGAPVQLMASDIQVGQWYPNSKTFTAGAGYPFPNAVKVTAQLTAARSTAIPTLFASILGSTSCDLHASSVATVVYPVQNAITVPGTSDPWLAGMPSGTTANYYSAFGDHAPYNSPTQIPGTLISGQVLNFQFQGAVSNWAGANSYGCDGDAAWSDWNWWAQANGNSEHGIANLNAPLASVIGVFLDDTEPDTTSAPAALDFSSPASRDYATLSPLLKQPFFIGDGLRADGVTLQGIVVPPGATRLYIGCMDFQQWSDNSGNMGTTVTATPLVTLVN